MKKLLEACGERLGRAVNAFPWEDENAYADFLAQTYYYVRHSTRLLACAAARFEHSPRGDALHTRFGAHIAEERRHEQLCVHDLKVMGRSIDQYRERHTTRMFYETQYYKIEHLAPITIFGYILPLEAIGPLHGARAIERIKSRHGERPTAFLKLHTEEDVDHLDKAFLILEDCSPAEQELIRQNMAQTTYGYELMVKEISARDEPGGGFEGGAL